MNNLNARKEIINKASAKLIEVFNKKGLKSLYDASSPDITKFSDIDIFGIVDKKFKIIKSEELINKHFEEKQKLEYKNIEVRFRAIGLDELNGARPRGIIGKYIGLRFLLKNFAFYNHLWGKNYDFSKFKLKPYTLKEEKEILSKNIINFINALKKQKPTYPIQNFPKDVIRLARIEAIEKYNFKLSLSYKEIANHFKKQKTHIVHDMMKLRREKVTRDKILRLEGKIINYVSRMK